MMPSKSNFEVEIDLAEPIPPYVGAVVHFTAIESGPDLAHDYATVQRAALVTAVEDPEAVTSYVSLVIFHPTGLEFVHDVLFSDSARPGRWSWPAPPPLSATARVVEETAPPPPPVRPTPDELFRRLFAPARAHSLGRS
jgi:hypothetical protein